MEGFHFSEVCVLISNKMLAKEGYLLFILLFGLGFLDKTLNNPGIIFFW